jgi:geranylgeranyl diphosphate synthase type I
MNLYEASIQPLLNDQLAKDWPVLHMALTRALTHQPVAWHFPVKACQAVGSKSEVAIPAIRAISCAHMAIMLVDDMLDDDPRGIYHELGAGRTANLAAALYSLGIQAILDSDCSQREAAASELAEMISCTAYGQELDVQNTRTEEGYWAVTRAKSSPYFSAALAIGAMFGGATSQHISGIKIFGAIYGEIMQIHDDLNDSLAVPANVDWKLGRSPLPILFAQLVNHRDRERFVELRGQVDDPDALTEAQSILVRCGAISFCVNELVQRHRKAGSLLASLGLPQSGHLSGLLDEAIAPIQHLFTKVGADLQTTL